MKKRLPFTDLSFDVFTFSKFIFQEIESTQETQDDPVDQFLNEEWIVQSEKFDLTHFQQSWSFRNVKSARRICELLFNSKGELDLTKTKQLYKQLAEKLYPLGFKRQNDSKRAEHTLSILKAFIEDRELVILLTKISKPFNHKILDRIIRESLLLPTNKPLSDYHAKMAAFSALLTPLRQNVGSCFATAPAILIQQEQIKRFLKDIAELFATGQLKKVIEGQEYSVPACLSFGLGDLRKPLDWTIYTDKPAHYFSRAPGLIAAFEAAELISPDTPLDKKEIECEKLLSLTNLFSSSQPIISAETIIRRVLMSECHLSQDDLNKYLERPKERLMGDIVIPSPLSGKGIGSACSRFLNLFELAKSAFRVLVDHPLLKIWEYTLASFSEFKAVFTTWNLYSSLGFNAEEPLGIGQCIYERIQEKINRINQEIEVFQSRYDHLFAQAKYLEGRMRSAGSESEMSWLQADYQIRKLEINQALNERDNAYEKGQRLTQLFSFLLKYYSNKFKEYFQEIYDPEMQDVETNPYDDSPAGFRLIYKHGRTNTSSWTMIHTPAEFSQALGAFFIATESELIRMKDLEGLESDLTDLVTTLVMHVKTNEFLESSIVRMAKAHHLPPISNPLDNLERIDKKPWAYTSGGAMTTLLSCYYQREAKPTEKARWVENELELLVFYIDTMKELPSRIQKIYESHPERGMLAFSPTHAFIFKPGLPLFQQAWKTNAYTYTWVRDLWLLPRQNFYSRIALNSRECEHLLQLIALKIPEGYRSLFKHIQSNFNYPLSPKEFRDHILKTLSYEQWIKRSGSLLSIAEEIDSVLFASLPLLHEYQLKEALLKVFEHLKDFKNKLEELLPQLEDAFGRYKIFTAADFRDICCSLIMLMTTKTKHRTNWYQKIQDIMIQEQLFAPPPILFADTNWINNYFAFVVNPGTEELEFWRVNESGTEGRPIIAWKKWLNGSDKTTWGVHPHPFEYGEY